MISKPYLFLNHEPGRTDEVISLVQEIEQRGFPGIFSSGTPGDNIALSLLLLERTSSIIIGTGIAGIYARHAHTMATGAELLEELYPGRFMLGLGVTHVPWLEDMGVTFGKPLSDMRRYIQSIRGATASGACPPILVGALRRRMTALAAEVGDGVIWANAALSHLPVSMQALGGDLPAGFILSNSAPVCVHNDRGAALDAIRRYLLFYMKLKHYQNYWIEAGYELDVERARAAAAHGNDQDVMACITEDLANAVGIFGTSPEVRAGVERWQHAGITHLILDPVSATTDDALAATREVMDALD